MVLLTLTRLVVFFLVLSLVTLPATVSQAQKNTTSNEVRYFYETGHSMKGMFRVFWEANGGVETFGYPITEEYADPTTGHTVQYFERARFELKDRNGEPYVDLGKLGLEILEGRTFPQAQPIFDTAQRRYIDEAGYIIQYGFKEIWEKRGGERIFGLPVSNEVEEWVPDGSLRTVQYFEHARFEYWPEFAPGRRVLLTHLGRRLAPRAYLEQIPPPGSTSFALQSAPYPESNVSSGTKVGNPIAMEAPAASTQGSQPAIEAPAASTQGSQPAMEAPAASTQNNQPSYSPAPYMQLAPADYGQYNAPSASSMFLLPDAFTTSSNEVFRPSPPLVLLGPEDSTTIKPVHTDNTALPESFNAFVKPKIGTPGSSFALEAHGFEGGEIVGIWLSGPNEENFDVQMNMKADKDGVIGRYGLVNVGTKSDFFEGVWSINAQGVDSGRHAIGYFRLSRSVDPSMLPRPAPIPFPVFVPESPPQTAQLSQSASSNTTQPNTTQPNTAGTSPAPSSITPEDIATSGKLLHEALPATGNSLVMPLAGPAGTPFVLLAQGYLQDEKVEAWVTTPDDTSIAIDAAQMQVDSNGSAQVRIVSEGFTDGISVIVAKGTKSGTINSASFMITSAYRTDPNTPRPVNIHGSATPSQGGMNTIFELRGYGLQPDEALESWITDPTGAYTFLPEAVYADAQGRVGYQPVLNIVANHELVPGVYGFHFRGKTSGRQVSIYFTYFE